MAGSRAIDKLRVQGCATPRFTPKKGDSDNFRERPKGTRVPVELSDGKPVLSGLASAAFGKENMAASRRESGKNYSQRSVSVLVKRDNGNILSENVFLVRGKTLSSEDIILGSKQRTVGKMDKSESGETAGNHVDTNDRFSYGYLGEFLENARVEESYSDDVEDSGVSILTHSSAGSVASNPVVYHLRKPISEWLEAKMATPLSLQRNNKLRHSFHGTSGLALTGQKLQPSREPDVDLRLYDDSDNPSPNLVAPGAADQHPFLSPTSTARRRIRPPKSNSPSETKALATDPSLLQRCLRVKLPNQSESDPIRTFNDGVKMKPFSHFAIQAGDKRNVPSSERASKKQGDLVLTPHGRYSFNSVDSYINFRRVQSQLSVENQGESKPLTRSASFKFLTRIQPDGSFAAVTDRMLRSSLSNKNSEVRSAVPRNKFIKDESDSMQVVGIASVREPLIAFATKAKSNRSITRANSWGQVKQGKVEEALTQRAASIVSSKDELDRAGSPDIKGGEAVDNNKGALNDASYHSREASRAVGFDMMKSRVDGTRSESCLDSINKTDGLLHADAESIESARQKDNSVHSGSIRSFPSDADNELTDIFGSGSGIDI